jgi:hypothetical protein
MPNSSPAAAGGAVYVGGQYGKDYVERWVASSSAS